MVVVWSDRAKADLQKAYDYIALDSVKNASLVRDTLIDLTAELAADPEKYPLDKFKEGNNGKWRALEKYHYRISYRVTKDLIRIARMRHTKRSPYWY